MRYLIRKANRNDIPQLEKLLDDYMRETYKGFGQATRRVSKKIY